MIRRSYPRTCFSILLALFSVLALNVRAQTPSPPTVSSPVQYCLGATPSALTATPDPDHALLWYDVATGGTGSTTAPTPTTTTAGETKYYVSQYDLSTSDESQRDSITVIVHSLPSAPTVITPVDYCQDATPSSLYASGTGLKWYTASTGGSGSSSAPIPGTSTVGTTYYYVSQTNSTTGCESPRATVSVVVNSLPAAPTVTATVQYCENATATALTATGTGLLWYDAATGGTGSSSAPVPSTATAGSTDYYVSQTDATTGCEGPRAKITVVVNSLPSAPVVTTPVTYCKDVTASALSATGSGLLWYTAATGGSGSSTAITPGTSAVGTTNYYVTQTNSTTGCESPRASIAVVINDLPAAPTVTSPVEYCLGATTSALTATGTGLLWYTTATGGSGSASAPTPTSGTAGTTSYYVTQTDATTSCESPRAEIEVEIHALPAAPTVTSPIAYCVDAVASALTATGTDLLWYDAATGGTGDDDAPTPSTSSVGTTVYYVSQTDANGCEGSRASITVQVKTLPSGPSVTTPVNYCRDATATALTAVGAGLKWYSAATGGSGSSTAPTPSTASAGTTTYYVSQTDPSTGCESSRASINVVVSATAAPTVITPVSYCVGATPSTLTATGTSLKWYDVATGGTSSSTAPTPSTGSAGTISYYVTQTDATTSCESPRAEIKVVVNDLPVAPTVTSPVEYCEDESATALTATGTSLKWYSAATGGTGSTTAPTPSTSSEGTTSYFVSQTNTTTGCEGPRAEIEVIVNPLPLAPTVTTPVHLCIDGPSSALTATGTDLLWYDAATGGTGSTTAPTPSTAATGTTDFYVSQTSTLGCGESPRAKIEVIVHDLPAAPTVTSPVTYCQEATASALTATGTNLKWYNVATGGTGSTTAPTPSTTATGTTNYYVSQTGTVSGCEGPRATIEVTINTTPAAPTVTSPVEYCEGSSASELTATGTDLLWYTVATGGTGSTIAPTPITSTPGTTNYYVTQTDATSGCESPRATIAVVVKDAPPAAPTVTSPVTYCEGVSASALTATGTGLLWFDAATGGTGSSTAPTPSTSTAGTTTYYVSQTSDLGCGESSRSSITVVVNALPAAPTVTSPVTYCAGATAATLTATGTDLLWYDIATGGTGSTTAPTPSTTSAGTTNYYVTQTNSTTGCESPRSVIAVTVNPLPSAPSVTSPVNLCLDGPSSALTATGSNLLWYDVATGGAGSTTAPTPSTTATGTTNYYVTQTNSTTGCESPRSSIVVNVNTIPSAPTVTSPVTYCSGTTATALTATGTGLLWYDAATGGTGAATAPTPSTVSAGTTTYYVSQTSPISGCESPRASIDVVVNTTPAAPAVTTPVNYCVGATATALTATGTDLLWYDAATGGTGSATAPTPSTASVGSTDFYVSQTNTTTGCESPRASITVVVNTTPVAPTVTTPVTYCQDEVASPLTATGTDLLWYTAATGGTGSSTAPTPNTSTTGTTNYYVSQTSLYGCGESPRIRIEVTVNPLPSAPGVPSAPVLYCRGEVASPLSATGTDLLWYTTATGGTGSATAPTPNTAVVGVRTYYVTQTNATTGCESPRAMIVVNVRALPALPAVTTPIAYCLGSTATALTATGTGLLWYDAATGGTGDATAPTPSTVSVGSESYYVTQTDATTGCESPRAEISVVINDLPSEPAVTVPFPYCQGATATVLSATGTGLLWYNDATGGTGSTTAPTPSTATPGTTTYYVTQTDAVTGCESPRADIPVVVNPSPAAPTVVSPLNLCIGSTASPLTATGTDLLWYNAATGGTGSATAPTPATTATGSTDYYVSQTSEFGCGESPRALITVVVNDLPAPPTIATDSFTYCESATATALTATGTDLLWYDVATGGTGDEDAPTPSTTIGGVTRYYVSQTDALGCESLRDSIAVLVNITPEPAVTTPVNYCLDAPTSILTATGTDLLWYDDATGGTGSTTAPTPTSTDAGTTNYYVTQTDAVTGCESQRALIEVIVHNPPSEPTVTTPVQYCEGATATALTASGSGLLWYDAATGGTGDATAPTPSTTTAGTTDFYVSRTSTSTGCESPRAKIEVIVNPIPAEPVITTPLDLCVGGPTAPLTATGDNIKWYTVATGGTPSPIAPTPSTASVTTRTYYVSQTSTAGCESDRAEFVVNVRPLPTVSVISTSPYAPIFCHYKTITLKADAPTAVAYQWSTLSLPVPGATDDTFRVGTTGISSVIVTDIYGCQAEGSYYALEDTTAHPALSPSTISFCEGNSGLLTVNPGFVSYTFVWYKDGVPMTPATPRANTRMITAEGDYYVAVTNDFGCVDTTNTAVATFYPNPPKPVITHDPPRMSVPAAYTHYQWYRDGIPVAGANNFQYILGPDATGDYYVQVTNEYGCITNSDTLLRSVGIKQPHGMAGEIRIYPNPTRQVVYFQSPIAISISVTDITGKEVLTAKDVKEVDMVNLADGTYYFRIFDSERQLITIQKIVKMAQ